MVLDWLLQLASAALKLFIHPIFYFSFILAFIVGMFRVTRERKDFSTRIYDIYQEIRFILPSSLAIGAVLSVITVAAGLALPAGLLNFTAAILIVFSIAGFFLLSPAWTMGAAYSIFVLSEWFDYPFIPYDNLNVQAILSVFSIVTGLLVIAEGVLIHKRGHQGTSPRIEKNKRGLLTVVHLARRLWLVPVFLPVPSSKPLTPFAEWWPVIDTGAVAYSFVLFPFLIGFSMTVRSTLPAIAVKSTGKSVIKAGVLTLIMAILSYWIWQLSAVAVLFAVLARLGIMLRHYNEEKHRSYYFTAQSKGIIIAGVLPASPARKMGIEIGDVITKVNDVPVSSEPEFYTALQKNAAYCKMEVIGTNNQLRFVQGSIYANDHHELGLIFVPEEKEYLDDSIFTE